jgi:hypothetical protein
VVIPGRSRRSTRVFQLFAGRALRIAGVALPILLGARPLADPVDAIRAMPVPDPHSVDIWGQHTDGLDFDVVGAKAASRAQLNRFGGPGALADEVRNPTGALGGFLLVGSVAVIAADKDLVTPKDTGYGIVGNNLAVLSTRFIQTFGDDYDQIAVFLAFPDRLSPNALAYQQPVKNDVRGLGLQLFDLTAQYGSKGRMQTVLNMKRINLYGRDAAGDPDNGLYPVWAQEAAHRWLVYFRFRRSDEANPNESLLGRQKAHWARGVEAEGSIMDGYDWKDNGDGTYTPGKRSFRYGQLDQYGMGLRTAEEVKPFFILEDLQDGAGNVIPMNGGVASAGRYKGRRVELTAADIIRAVGPREPAKDPAAQDMRMAVVLLGAPGEDIATLIGEAFQIDTTRRLWTDFYNTAGGGRGKVCTDLLRPCRGEAFGFGEVRLEDADKNADGVVSRGERFNLKVEVRNTGDQPARADLRATAPGLTFDEPAAGPMLNPGDTATVTLTGGVGNGAVCGEAMTLDLKIAGARGPSRELRDTVIGLEPKAVESFDGGSAPAGWRVNPDGTDTGTAGRWAWGKPERATTAAYDSNFTLQPGAAFSGERGFSTGLSAMETDNVEGTTTLESPAIGVRGLRSPVLSYQVYFVAATFKAEVLVPEPSGALRVLASADGKNFVEVDRVTGMTTGWQRRVVRLGTKLAALKDASEVRLRFVAEETTRATSPVVEATIDEVGLFDEAASCMGDVPEPPAGGETPKAGGDGCNCALGATNAGAGGGGFWAVLLGLGVVGARARRRAKTPPVRSS